MKMRLKKYSRMIHKYHRDIVKALTTVILFAFTFACGTFLHRMIATGDVTLWQSFAVSQESEICVLCGNGQGTLYHAPVLVNLSTGEVGELRVYDSELYQSNKLAETQSTGIFVFMRIANLNGYRDTSNHTCYVTIPQESAPIDASHFCSDCQALLPDTADTGYILADIYDLDRITAYSIEKDAQYTIRDYAVYISAQDRSDNLSVTVTGLLSMDNKIVHE